MKVVYKKHMDEQLMEAIRHAASQGRAIEQIELTEREMDELEASPVGRYMPKRPFGQKRDKSQISLFMGVRLVEVD